MCKQPAVLFIGGGVVTNVTSLVDRHASGVEGGGS